MDISEYFKYFKKKEDEQKKKYDEDNDESIIGEVINKLMRIKKYEKEIKILNMNQNFKGYNEINNKIKNKHYINYVKKIKEPLYKSIIFFVYFFKFTS